MKTRDSNPRDKEYAATGSHPSAEKAALAFMPTQQSAKNGMDNGIAKFNPKGCDGLCNEYHPKDMCRLSISKGACDRDQCRFKHTRNSKVKNGGKKSTQTVPTPTPNTKIDVGPVGGQQAEVKVKSPTPNAGMTNGTDPFLSLMSLVNVMLTKLTNMEQELNQLKNFLWL